MWARVGALLLPAMLGAWSGRAGLFEDPDAALRALNAYALNIGFPALIAVSLMGASLTFPSEPGFWAIWPASLLLTLVVIRAHPLAATLGLIACFGNVAYLGLPYVTAIYGPEIAGPAALLVSVHVIGAVTVGPWVLARWGRGKGRGGVVARLRGVARMPLFWAPWFGVAARWLPPEPLAFVGSCAGSIAASAAPVALFLLGLYLWGERATMTRPNREVAAHLMVRGLWLPGVVLGMCVVATRMELLSPSLAKLHVTLAATPVALTTFSMALDQGEGQRSVGAAIVWSSFVALGSLPLWTWAGEVVF